MEAQNEMVVQSLTVDLCFVTPYSLLSLSQSFSERFFLNIVFIEIWVVNFFGFPEDRFPEDRFQQNLR